MNDWSVESCYLGREHSGREGAAGLHGCSCARCVEAIRLFSNRRRGGGPPRPPTEPPCQTFPPASLPAASPPEDTGTLKLDGSSAAGVPPARSTSPEKTSKHRSTDQGGSGVFRRG